MGKQMKKNLNNVVFRNEALFHQEELILEATELISSIMEASSVSKAALARKMKKSKAFVTQCLSGEQNLTLRTLADIFTALEYQLQLGAVPSPSSNFASNAIQRSYPVRDWAYEMATADKVAKGIRPCAAA